MRPALALVVAVLVAGTIACGPSEECRRYVECQNAVDPSVSTAAWDDGGSCWTTLQTAEACTAQCRAALDALADSPGAPAVCVEGADLVAGAD
jgi:hypothetical protein